MIDKNESLGSETEQVEFKKSTGEIKEAVISIAAILNKHGMGLPSCSTVTTAKVGVGAETMKAARKTLRGTMALWMAL